MEAFLHEREAATAAAAAAGGGSMGGSDTGASQQLPLSGTWTPDAVDERAARVLNGGM